MCLALPGKIISLDLSGPLPMGEVDFSGVIQTVCLAYTPEAILGNYVIVHVGFALSIIQEGEAEATLRLSHEVY